MSAVVQKPIKKAAQASNLANRFAKFNQHRLKRVLDAVSPRQRDFLEMLPLLFHVNHPLLPGYISKDIPAGIADYAPSKSAIKAAKKVTRSFDYDHRLLRFFPIQGLFSMGSPGTIAYSKTSDLDMWLCFDPAVEETEVELLSQKAQAIEKYASKLGLEVHFFILSAANFRSGQTLSMSSESSGSSQHALLLDEFYRSSLLVAGLPPLWWCVPLEHEHRYDDYVGELIAENKDFGRDYLDFGGLSGIPASEFFGAGVWQLYKSIDSPFKSVLKLLLIESYVTEYPDIDLLSYAYKELIAKDSTSINDVDPYVLMYRKVDDYLKRSQDEERRKLLEKCFYLKINLPLSKRRVAEDDWQGELLTEFVGYWEWPVRQLEYLDNRPTWKINDALEERQLIVAALNKSYALLSDFARQRDEKKKISQHDLHILGRKLYAAFERKPAKVEIITRGICKQPAENHLAVSWRPTEDNRGLWHLYTEHLKSDGLTTSKAAKSSESLSRLLSWCHFNHLVGSQTQWQVFAPENKLQSPELLRVLEKINEFFPDGVIPAASSQDLSVKVSISKILLIVNFGQTPLQGRFNQQVLTTNHNDAFKFGGQKINLIQSAAIIYVTSWEEVYVRNFKGPLALHESFLGIAQQLHSNKDAKFPHLDVFAACRNYSLAIRNTAERYGKDLLKFLDRHRDANTLRYISQVGNEFCSTLLKHGKATILHHSSYHGLLRSLAEPNNEEHPTIAFDQSADACQALKSVYENSREGEIDFFILQHEGKADIYIVDEKGSLFIQRRPSDRLALTINQFGQFFKNILEGRQQDPAPTVVPTSLGKMSWNVLRKDNAGRFAVSGLTLQESTFDAQVPVKVFVDANTNESQIINIIVKDLEFSAAKLGADLFKEIAWAIVEGRDNHAHYPIYINNLEFSEQYQASHDITALQTIHLLNFKKRIEYRLTSAIEQTQRDP